MIRRIAVLLVAGFFATAAFAADPVASVTKNSGSVMVSHDGGPFQPVATGQSLVPGDRVMVGEGGSVVVTFGNDGCQMSVKAGTIATVPANSTCAGDEVATEDAPKGGAAGGSTSPDFDWATFGWVAIPTMAYFVTENEGQTASP